MFWVISVYFNVRNILPKSGTFRPGHPVYIFVSFPFSEIFFSLPRILSQGKIIVLCSYTTRKLLDRRQKPKTYRNEFLPAFSNVGIVTTITITVLRQRATANCRRSVSESRDTACVTEQKLIHHVKHVNIGTETDVRRCDTHMLTHTRTEQHVCGFPHIYTPRTESVFSS